MRCSPTAALPAFVCSACSLYVKITHPQAHLLTCLVAPLVHVHLFQGTLQGTRTLCFCGACFGGSTVGCGGCCALPAHSLGRALPFWSLCEHHSRVLEPRPPCVQIFEKKPTATKNFGLWVRYQSRTGYHNMFKEYRDLTLNGAVDQMYTEMASRHRVRSHQIHIIKTTVVKAADCKREAITQFLDSKIKYPVTRKCVPSLLQHRRSPAAAPPVRGPIAFAFLPPLLSDPLFPAFRSALSFFRCPLWPPGPSIKSWAIFAKRHFSLASRRAISGARDFSQAPPRAISGAPPRAISVGERPHAVGVQM